jgi:hypothetical protein
MPTVDLRQDYRFGGRLYRSGRNVEVPAALAQRIGGETLDAPPQRAGGALPYADLLIPKPFKNEDAVRAASDDEITAVDGIGPARLAEIRAYFAG